MSTQDTLTISIGSDHAGYAHKEELKKMLIGAGYVVLDVGTNSTDRVDYPDFGVKAAKLVADGSADYGVIVCGTGVGISIAANKIQGIRAANVTSVEMAVLAREHNNANIVAVGERITPLALAKEIVTTFLDTDFEGGRHTGRVAKLDALGGT